MTEKDIKQLTELNCDLFELWDALDDLKRSVEYLMGSDTCSKLKQTMVARMRSFVGKTERFIRLVLDFSQSIQDFLDEVDRR